MMDKKFFDKIKAEKTEKGLENIVKNYVEKNIPLTPEQIAEGKQLVNEYYEHVMLIDRAYGQAAYDVANNLNAFGRFGNKYFETVALMEGKTPEQLPDLKAKMMLSVAYHDAKTRLGNEGEMPHKDIYTIHQSATTSIGLSEKTWGGSFFHHFLGEGSYLDLGGYDTSIEVEQMRMLRAVALNQEVNGVSAREYISILSKVGVENFGDTAGALAYRTALEFTTGEMTVGPNEKLIITGNIKQTIEDIAKKYNVPLESVTEIYTPDCGLGDLMVTERGVPPHCTQKTFMITTQPEYSSKIAAEIPANTANNANPENINSINYNAILQGYIKNNMPNGNDANYLLYMTEVMKKFNPALSNMGQPRTNDNGNTALTKARVEFGEELQKCAKSPSCKDTTSSLISKIGKKYANEGGTQIYMALYNDANKMEDLARLVDSRSPSASTGSAFLIGTKQAAHYAQHPNGHGAKPSPYSKGVHSDIYNNKFDEHADWHASDEL